MRYQILTRKGLLTNFPLIYPVGDPNGNVVAAFNDPSEAQEYVRRKNAEYQQVKSNEEGYGEPKE